MIKTASRKEPSRTSSQVIQIKWYVCKLPDICAHIRIYIHTLICTYICTYVYAQHAHCSYCFTCIYLLSLVKG